MKVVVLGTSSVFPTRKRNHSAALLKYGGEGLLFDCGEGTQRQLRLANQNPMKINKVFITHWHGDHTLGLAGLMDSMAMNQGKKELEIYGPKGTKKKLKTLRKVFNINPSYKLEVHEVSPRGKSICVAAETEEYWVRAVKVSHTVPCVAYSWEQKPRIKINMDYVSKFGLKDHAKIEKLRAGKDLKYKGRGIKASKATFEKKGKKFSYVMDTSLVPQASDLVEGSDVLLCEATYLNELKANAKKRGHMTAKQAGKLAKSAGVDRLYLTHFSQRYKKLKAHLKEAKKVFKNTKLAKDLIEIKL